MIKNILKKYEELFKYLIVGGLTTFVNLFVYFVCISTFLNYKNGLELQIANIISWIISVAFSYVTNRLYVFKHKSKYWFQEMIRFFATRLFTLVLDMLIMFVYVTCLNGNGSFGKIISQLIVIILNYILCKFLVFKVR